jgi:hypothetical protein
MKTANLRNLDDANECAEFLAGYGHLKGARLARSLGLSGPGSIKAASDLLNYAQLKERATAERLDGRVSSALDYERMADQIYISLPESLRW